MKEKESKISRRKFMKDFGTTIGAATALASFPWLEAISEENRKASRGEKTRIAVVGTGSRGQYLLRLLVLNPKVEIAYLCDDYQPSLDKALEIAPGSPVTVDYRVVVDDKNVDGVVIATPLHVHREVAVAAMEAGKKVYCEKSLSLTLPEALDIYNTHKRTGSVLFVGQQRLFDPVYLKGIEMIHAGAFGEIQGINTYWYRNGDWRRKVPSPELERKINWRLYRDYSCGLMTELACHQVQLGTWIWRDIPERIYATGATTYWKDGREVEDNVGVVYTYKNGCRMSFDSIISNRLYGYEEQVLGNLGALEFEAGKIYWEKTPPMPGFLRMLNDIETDLFTTLNFGGPSWDPETAKKNHGEYIMGRKRTYQDGTEFAVDAFVESAITGEQPPMIAQEGYYATVLSLLGQQSIDEKREIIFPDEYKIEYL